MDRRPLLGTAAVGGLAVTAGCLIQAGGPLSGSNSTLVLTNAADRDLAVGLTVERSGEPTPVYDDTVRLAAGTSRESDVLGDAQYFVTVTVDGESERFPTRPICGAASTETVVRGDQENVGRIDDCE